MSIRETILAQIKKVADELDRELPALADDTVLMDTGLDSLSFAILVARLEEALGFDPFSSAQGANYPVTLGDFIKLYEDAAR